jgi:lipopolysaccharide transport system ATP-binding protein
MSSDPAIHIESLSKCFNIYETPRDRLLQMLSIGDKKYYREFWALRDASFTVRRGETVGIVGRNGSGKSTLLQLICGTLNPTAGEIITHGRIAALLELGSGFNPEFSGRENVFMNAAVLGLSHEETKRRFPAIEAFAEIGSFIDQPVKTYSSGMLVRLAFAVAINVDAQILIIDEALAVGDELFQRKCYGKIESLKQSGATILFVSHSGGTVIEFCDRAVLLDSGEVLAIGQPKAIVSRYQRLIYASEDKRERIRNEIRLQNFDEPDASESGSDSASAETVEEPANNDYFDPNLKPQSTVAYESNGAHISEPAIYTRANKLANTLTRGETYFYRYKVKFSKSVSNVRFGMMIKTTSGFELGGGVSSPVGEGIVHVAAGEEIDVEFKFHCKLNTGTYFLNAGVAGSLGEEDTFLHRIIDVYLFKVSPNEGDMATGVVDFDCVASSNLQVDSMRQGHEEQS